MSDGTRTSDNARRLEPSAISLPLPLKRRVDKICDEFEAAWNSGQRPNIEDYLGAIPDPERSALLQELIKLDPAEPANYVQLAKLYQDAGVYDEAEKMYVYATQAKPSDTGALMQLAGFYNSMGAEYFDKTIAALQKRAELEPNNPEAYFTISTYYWDNAQRNVALKKAEKLDYVGKGLTAVNKAIEIRPDYMEALTYKGLLLRTEANLEGDPAKQQALLKEAIQLQNQAEELRKKKAAGVTSN